MSFVIHEYIAVDGIKDIVLTVGVISATILRMEAKTDKLIVYLPFSGQAGFGNKRL